MELQDVLSEIGEEKANVILSAIEAEKARGISESKKKGSEAQKLRSELAKVKLEYKEVFGHEWEGDDVRTLFENAKQTTAKTASVNTNDFVPVREFKRLTQQLEEERQEREKTAQKWRVGRLSQALTQAMGDKVYARDFVVQNLIDTGKVRLSEDDSVVYVDNDSEYPLDKGMEMFRKARPDVWKNTQAQGSGGTGGKQTKDNKQIALADFNALPGRERAKLMAEGYKLIQ